MSFKGSHFTPFLANSSKEIFSGDGTVLSNNCTIIGYWNPEHHYSGVGTTYYNQVTGYNDSYSGNNLELKNGIAFNSGESVKYFEVDGTDDYIGAVDDGYGSQFVIDHGQPWSICVWVRFDVLGTAVLNSYLNPILEIGRTHEPNGGQGFTMVVTQEAFMSFLGIYNQYLIDEQPPQPKTGEWYFLGATKLGPNTISARSDYDFYIDGRYTLANAVGNSDSQFSYAEGVNDLILGRLHQYTYGMDAFFYAKDGTKFGEIIVYSGNIGLSRMIQNYNATKEKYNKNHNNF